MIKATPIKIHRLLQLRAKTQKGTSAYTLCKALGIPLDQAFDICENSDDFTAMGPIYVVACGPRKPVTEAHIRAYARANILFNGKSLYLFRGRCIKPKPRRQRN